MFYKSLKNYQLYKQEVFHILQQYLNNEKILQMKQYIQHNQTSTYQHSIDVAILSYMISNILTSYFSITIHKKQLVIGALLHDFFLYDWHDGRFREEGFHTFCHPTTALKNASKYFHLTSREKNIIETHMFPVTITKIPRFKEAWIVSLADKICAFNEMISLS